MISAKFRRYTEPLFQAVAKHFAYLPPTIITFLSIIFAIIAAYFFYQQDWFTGGLFALFAAFLDALDGAIARYSGRVSERGGYLDAIVDRYVEGILLFGIGLGTGLWHLVFLALMGAYIIPYAKARVALEKQVDNINWPDLMERAERLILIAIIFPFAAFYGYAEMVLIIMVILFHLTALQRVLRAYKMLR